MAKRTVTGRIRNTTGTAGERVYLSATHSGPRDAANVRGPDEEPTRWEFLVSTILDTLLDAGQSIGTCGLILGMVAAWLYGLSGARRG
jgi:hypothetical protein